MAPLDPGLARQNGSLTLKIPYALGVVRFAIVTCRDIAAIRDKYGLGAVSLYRGELSKSPSDFFARYYSATVQKGDEPTTLRRLAAHPEDFQYTELAWIPVGGAPEVTFVRMSTIDPSEGPVGTSFQMRFCCFDAGTAVTKTFKLPDGTSTVVNDIARADTTVAAMWGGGPNDQRGDYTVVVQGAGRGSLLTFSVR